MQHLTTLSTGHSQLPTSQQLWSLEVSAVWMGSDLTALPSSPGQRGKPWSGMSRAGTLLRPATYACMSSSRAGSLADHAAERKRSLYEELSITHIFQPIAFESTGVFGQDALDFFYDLAQRSRCITHDPLTYLKLCQKISVCMQNFNAVSINGCCTV